MLVEINYTDIILVIFAYFLNNYCIPGPDSSLKWLDPEPSLTPAHQAEPWGMSVKSYTLESCGKVGGSSGNVEFNDQKQQCDMGGEGDHAVSANFTPPKLQATGQGGRGQKND